MCESLDGDREGPCEAEVADFNVAGLGDKEVLRLEIAMNNALGVTVVDSSEDLD